MMREPASTGQGTRVILYEYPFNERIRTYLRLEHLFGRLGQLLPREAAIDHHFALVTLFDVLDVASRVDLKTEVLKDLDRQKSYMTGFRGNPAISEVSLDTILARLDSAFTQLGNQQGKPGLELNENDWLMSVRSRVAIPGGTCEFDLPTYHAWQQGQASGRRSDLRRWVASLGPMAQSVSVLLEILRSSGKPGMMAATAGQYQMSLPQSRPAQLLRLQLDESLGVVPEISGNRLAVSIRFMRLDIDGKQQFAAIDAPFELTLCS